jgi:hypothetical protein
MLLTSRVRAPGIVQHVTLGLLVQRRTFWQRMLLARLKEILELIIVYRCGLLLDLGVRRLRHHNMSLA